jgi:hypothetical protein
MSQNCQTEHTALREWRGAVRFKARQARKVPNATLANGKSDAVVNSVGALQYLIAKRYGSAEEMPQGFLRRPIWRSRSRRIERFRAKWTPVRVKKTRQNKRLEPGSDSIRTD